MICILLSVRYSVTAFVQFFCCNYRNEMWEVYFLWPTVEMFMSDFQRFLF